MKGMGEKEFGVLELGPDFFTFRLSRKYEGKASDIKSLTLYFYSFEKEEYKEVSLNNFSVCMEDGKTFYINFRVEVNDPVFKLESGKLSRSYLDYIDNKLTLTDDELAGTYTKYPVGADNCFYKDREDSYRGFFEKALKQYDAKAWEAADLIKVKLYYEISNEKALKKMLESGPEEYRSEFMLELCKLNHPISEVQASGFIFGNSYCPNMMPEEEILYKAAKQCFSAGVEVFIAIPPVPESSLKHILEYTDRVVSNIPNLSGLLVNDMGMYDYLSNKYHSVRTETGILLHKGYRDVRNKYLFNESDNLMKTDRFIFGPLYQTNTSSFCTLHALASGKRRGDGERIIRCERYCEDYSLVYPKHMDAIGLHNSLFGFETSFLSKPDILIKLMGKGKERLVINL